MVVVIVVVGVVLGLRMPGRRLRLWLRMPRLGMPRRGFGLRLRMPQLRMPRCGLRLGLRLRVALLELK